MTGVITFFMKGADSVMSNIVQYSDWLEEEVRREGYHLADSPLSLLTLSVVTWLGRDYEH